MLTIDDVFTVVIILFSAILHEVAHGYAALFQGDGTAKYEGRLTLNPLTHIDLIGSILVPLGLYISQLHLVHKFMFGWAKPVPFNPYNLRNRKWGEALVAIAGPLTNIVIALIFSLIIRFAGANLSDSVNSILKIIVFINITLAVFNLVPIAPLDGSKVLFAFLPASAGVVRRIMEQYSIFFVLIFIFLLWDSVAPLIGYIFYWFTGTTL